MFQLLFSILKIDYHFIKLKDNLNIHDFDAEVSKNLTLANVKGLLYYFIIQTRKKLGLLYILSSYKGC